MGWVRKEGAFGLIERRCGGGVALMKIRTGLPVVA